MKQRKISSRREAALRAFARRLKEEALTVWEERVLASAPWDEDEDPATKAP